MISKYYISSLRNESRKLVRELGMLSLSHAQNGRTSSHWHALIEISKEPGITITALSNLLLLSPSTVSRIIDTLAEKDLVSFSSKRDKREKSLTLTPKGGKEIKQIDDYSNTRIVGALSYLNPNEQNLLLEGIFKYASALEKSRQEQESIKIHTLPTSRPIRNQVIHMIEKIQKDEFSIPITPDINSCILKAEESFYYQNHCNFWYATSSTGTIIGSIGLKRISDTSGEVKKFFVHKDYRGKGTAHKLMKKMTQAAKKNNFQFLYLGTVSILEVAQNYYEKIGYCPILKTDLPVEFDICPLDSVFFKGEVSKITDYFTDL